MIEQVIKLIETAKSIDPGLAAVMVVGLGFVVLIFVVAK